MASQENHVEVVNHLLNNGANPALSTEVGGQFCAFPADPSDYQLSYFNVLYGEKTRQLFRSKFDIRQAKRK